MVDILPEYYRELYEMNVRALEMVKHELWDEFVVFAERYVIKKQDMVNTQIDELSAAEKESLKVILKEIIDNEAEITRYLQTRLSALKENLSSLHNGAKYSQLYSRQQVSSLH